MPQIVFGKEWHFAQTLVSLQFVSDQKKRKIFITYISPAILSTLIALGVYLVLPNLGPKAYWGIWLGTYMVWYMWMAVLALQ